MAKITPSGPVNWFNQHLGAKLALAPRSEARGYEIAPGQLDELEGLREGKYPRHSLADEVCSPSVRPRFPPVLDRPTSISTYLRNVETMGAHRIRPRKNAKETLENLRITNLKEFPISESLLRTLDKAFASAWLDDDFLLVGTKCNSLLCIEAETRAARRLSLPEQPARPLGYTTMPNHFGFCGIHAIAVNPSATLVATGGVNCNDIAVLSVPEDKATGSFTPVGTFVGHQDWLFGVSWLTDDVFVSGSRDQTLKLWSVRGAQSANYLPLATTNHQSRARVVKYDALGGLVTLGTDGVVRFWDHNRFIETDAIYSGYNREVVCMDQKRHVIVVGSHSNVTTIDGRMPSLVSDVESIDQGHGVRSVALKDHLIAIGTGRGRLAFFDRRVNRFLDIFREETADTHATTILNPVGSPPGPGTPADGPALGAAATMGAYPSVRFGSASEGDVSSFNPPAARPSRLLPEKKSYQFYQTQGGWMEPNDVYRQHFQGMHVFSACYSLSFSPSGRRLFTSGGPLAFGLRGCAMSLFSS